MNEEKKITKAYISMTDEEVEERAKVYDEAIDTMAQSYRAEARREVMVKVQKEEKSPEEKEYILLLVDIEDEEATMFVIRTGRREAYEYIKMDIESMDIHKSTVLVEGIPIENRISVYKFMKHIQDKGFFEGDSFDIEDYNIGDDEDEDLEDNAINNSTVTESEESNAGIERVSPFMHLDSDSEEI